MAIHESYILESERQEVCFPKIYREKLAVRGFPKIARMNIVKAEAEVSTILLGEVDSCEEFSQGENLV